MPVPVQDPRLVKIKRYYWLLDHRPGPSDFASDTDFELADGDWGQEAASLAVELVQELERLITNAN